MEAITTICRECGHIQGIIPHGDKEVFYEALMLFKERSKIERDELEGELALRFDFNHEESDMFIEQLLCEGRVYEPRYGHLEAASDIIS